MKKPEEKREKVSVIMKGIVASTKADKTVSVYIERIFQHPVYKKIVRKKKKYLAHDENNKCKPGDIVKIQMIRPISKLKRWLVVDIESTNPAEEEVGK